MFKKNLISCLLGLLAVIPLAAFSEAKPANRIVVVPTCLIKHSAIHYQTLTTKDYLTLISVNEEGIMQLADAKHHQAQPCGGFMDVTADWNAYKAKRVTGKNTAGEFLDIYLIPKKVSVPDPNYTIKYQTQVNQLLKQINSTNIWSNLTTLSNFENRYAKSQTGEATAFWLNTQVKRIAKANNRKDVTTYFVNTDGYLQPSLVVKIGNSSEPGIVIGAHMDSFARNSEGKPSERQPGADDDGSGTVTILEAARTLLASGMTFKKPLYFIWYAAEEKGLVGSGYVVKDFLNKKIPVSAVAQFDMTGFAYKNDPTLWLLGDNVNQNLTSYLETLIKTYVKQPVGYTKCGYGCSDHFSWNQQGFAAAAPFEATFETYNKNIHSTQDTMDKLSLTHMIDFTKLAVAFAVELAEPIA